MRYEKLTLWGEDESEARQTFGNNVELFHDSSIYNKNFPNPNLEKRYCDRVLGLQSFGRQRQQRTSVESFTSRLGREDDSAAGHTFGNHRECCH